MAQNAQQLLDVINEKFLILAGEPDEYTKQVAWTALANLRKKVKALDPEGLRLYEKLYYKLCFSNQTFANLCQKLDKIWARYEANSALRRGLAAQAMQSSPLVNQTYGSQRVSHSVYDVPTGGRQNANTQFVQPGGPTIGGGTNMLTSPAKPIQEGLS